MVTIDYETDYWKQGLRYIAGIDEAGRGPLAGPVVAAAVIFPAGCILDGIDDSKKLTASKREGLVPLIQERAVSYGIGIVSPAAIDDLNILQATFQAMDEAIASLAIRPEFLLIDGNRFHPYPVPFKTIVGGDAASLSIAAASILAKVTRDRIMVEYDEQYPQYGFARHKGYGTREHRIAIGQYGLCAIHRRSFHLHNRQLEMELNDE